MLDSTMPERHVGCEMSGKWYKKKACQEFSVDGTAMGATIAHLYGTPDNDVITMIQNAEERAEREANLTGMPDEQRDWECLDDEWD